jgi:hypothetical protein
MTTLLTPEEGTPLTPLPWALLQTSRHNYLCGKRERMECVIANIGTSADAMLIFRAVHAFTPLWTALRIVKAKLYTEGGYGGATGLSAQFTAQEFLLLKRAITIAESEVGR